MDDIFASSDTDIGQAKGVTHPIETFEHPPQSILLRLRYSPDQREIIRKHIDSMLRAGVIEPSQSAWSAPIVLAPKKDGKWRFCISYKQMNKCTERKDVYQPPLVEDALDALSGHSYFSSLDMLSGYWQVMLHEPHRHKTAFESPDGGLFLWNRMPFGLTNAPATFQRFMDLTLSGLRWQCCIVYIDDIVVYSRSFEVHLRDLALIFQRLRQAGL